MGRLLKEMTPYEQELYNLDSISHPWLSSVSMSDDELLHNLERDLGKGISALFFHSGWRSHYGWVFVAVFKHFYETGEFAHYDYNYIDGQAEYQVGQIMEAWGADSKTWISVIDGESKFDFCKYKVPSNVPPVDRTQYKAMGIDNIFKDYYESHGFEYPF